MKFNRTSFVTIVVILVLIGSAIVYKNYYDQVINTSDISSDAIVGTWEPVSRTASNIFAQIVFTDNKMTIISEDKIPVDETVLHTKIEMTYKINSSKQSEYELAFSDIKTDFSGSSISDYKLNQLQQQSKDKLIQNNIGKLKFEGNNQITIYDLNTSQPMVLVRK
jgi:hypothetical protein